MLGHVLEAWQSGRGADARVMSSSGLSLTLTMLISDALVTLLLVVMWLVAPWLARSWCCPEAALGSRWCGSTGSYIVMLMSMCVWRL